MAKPKYFTHVEPKLDLVETWRMKGRTEKWIADKLGISVQSLNVYRKEHPEFSDALKRGKHELVKDLECALYKRAKGYDYEETHTEIEENERGKKVKKKIVKKHVPPDVGALVFSLTNLASDDWKNNRGLEKRLESEPEGEEDDGLNKQLEKIIDTGVWEGFEDDDSDES